MRKRLALAFLLAVTAAHADVAEFPAPVGPAGAAERKALSELWSRYAAALEAGADGEALAALLAGDARLREIGTGAVVEGAAAIAKALGGRLGAGTGYAELRWQPVRVLAARGQLVADGTWSGRLAQKPFGVRFLTRIVAHGGRVAEIETYLDVGGWGEQVEKWGRIRGLGPPVTTALADTAGATLDSSGVARLVARFYGIYHTRPFDLDAMIALYAPRCRFVDPTSRIDIAGRDAVREMLAGALGQGAQGFDGVRWALARVLHDGPYIAAFGTWSGTYQGKPFREVSFVTLWRVADGLIADQTDFIDMGDWSRQVGWTGAEAVQ
jgi:ketosteroid isomerase-like protein